VAITAALQLEASVPPVVFCLNHEAHNAKKTQKCVCDLASAAHTFLVSGGYKYRCILSGELLALSASLGWI